MNIFQLILLFLCIDIAVTIIFSFIYLSLDVPGIQNFIDALFVAIQVETCIGMVDGITGTSLKIWLSIQSVIATFVNILLIVFIGAYLGQFFTREIIANEK